jgi:hypothetical protein
VFLAERANFLIQIFLGKNSRKHGGRREKKDSTCLSLPQAPEEKRKKKSKNKAKQGENRLGVLF